MRAAMRVGELKKQESAWKGSELTPLGKTDQPSERDTNQHLLIASGVPRGESDLQGSEKERRETGKRDNRFDTRQRTQRSVTSSISSSTAGHSGVGGRDGVQLCSFLKSECMCDVPLLIHARSNLSYYQLFICVCNSLLKQNITQRMTQRDRGRIANCGTLISNESSLHSQVKF